MSQNIPQVTPEMLRQLPDQFCATLNRVINEVNKLKNNPS